MQSNEGAVDGEQSASKDTEERDETLKYHLLGPSLTKAGQDAVDQRKVSQDSCFIQAP